MGTGKARAGVKSVKDGGWILAVIFWLGIFAYNYAGPPLRDWLFVEPAIHQASALEAKGAEEAALPILLDQVADNPRSPILLWALGDIYTKMDRPLLARFYFHALSHTDTSDLDSSWRDFARTYQGSEDEAEREITDQEKALADDFRAYERTVGRNAIVYPDSVNAVLNQPASNVSLTAGYFPPRHPISCGADQPRCGYELLFDSGKLWSAIATQKLSISYPKGGNDCCSLSLDDPDLRSLDVVEREFDEHLEREGDRLSPTSEAGQVARLAFRARVLAKQLFLIHFAYEASTTVPDEGWTIWTWAKLIGWILFLGFANEAVQGLFPKLRPRQPVVTAPAMPRAISAKAVSWQTAARAGYVVIAAALLLLSVGYFASSAGTVTMPGSFVPGTSMLPHLETQQLRGNGINFAAGLSLVLVALLALNRASRSVSSGSGFVDRLCAWLSGSGPNRWRLTAVVLAVVTFGWLGNLLAAHTAFHWTTADAATAFSQEVEYGGSKVNGDWLYAHSRDDNILHIAPFTPAIVRAFDRADVAIGLMKTPFEYPVPGFLPFVILLVLCILAIWWRGRTASGWPAPRFASLFLVFGLLQLYLMLWLLSAQKGVTIFDSHTLNPDWLGPALIILVCQLILVTAVYDRLRQAALPVTQLQGWLGIYFLTNFSILPWAYWFSDAPLLTPALLWLLFYYGLAASLWFLMLASGRRVQS